MPGWGEEAPRPDSSAVESEPAGEVAAITTGESETHEPAHGHELIASAPQQPEPLAKAGPIYTLLYRRYFVDELYEGLLVRRIFYRYFAGMTDWLDRNLVDGLVDLVAWVTRQVGRLLAQLQTGQVQFYGSVIVLGAVLILLGYLIFGVGPGE